jgi:transcriptional regulator with XRE-family HTH domain
MEWEQVRAHYEQAFKRAKFARSATQQTVGAAGGVQQNTISKLMAKRSELGPSVGTLLGAIKGLGMEPSVFFAQIEKGEPPIVADASTAGSGRNEDAENLAQYAQTGKALHDLLQSLRIESPRPSRARKRRARFAIVRSK